MIYLKLMKKKSYKTSSITIRPSLNPNQNRFSNYYNDFTYIQPLLSLIVNFKEPYKAAFIRSIINRIFDNFDNNLIFANTQYFTIDVIYDYHTTHNNEHEYINIFDLVDDQYIQGFRIKIKPSNKMRLGAFIKSSYDIVMYIHKQFTMHDKIVILNYTVLVSLKSSLDFNTYLYSRLTELDFQTKNNINLNRIRNNKSLLTIPIKNKYNIKTLISLTG